MQALLFILIWVVVALTVFGVAFYRSRGDAEEKELTLKGRLPGGFKLAIALAAALLLFVIPGLVLSTTTDRLPSGSGSYELAADQAAIDGRNIFRSTCASCHTLGAANARGVYGPDLDTVLGTPGADPVATAQRVESAIKNGGTTGKQMPKNLLGGEDAKLVSEYIAEVAGK